MEAKECESALRNEGGAQSLSVGLEIALLAIMSHGVLKNFKRKEQEGRWKFVRFSGMFRKVPGSSIH